MEVTDIISILIAVIGFVFAFYIYLRDKRNKYIEILVKQIVAYHCEEDAAANMIAALHPGVSAKTIKTDLREQARIHPDNDFGERPNMTAKHAKTYITKGYYTSCKSRKE